MTELLEQQLENPTSTMRTSQTLLQAIFEDNAIGIALLDRKGIIAASNPALQKILGFTDQELIGRPYIHLEHADDRAGTLDLYDELIHGKRSFYQLEVRHIHKDGHPVFTNLTVSLARQREEGVSYTIVMIEDISERREIQMALIQAEKLAVTGQLAAVLAHEINNPLQSVIGFMSLAQEMIEEGAEQKTVLEYLQIAIEEVKRAAKIVTQMRDLNRKEPPGTRERSDFNMLVERVLTLSQKKLERQHIDLIWQVNPTLPLVNLSPNRIEQVLLNLLLNALDALPDGGKVQINLTCTADPKGVEINISDNGLGISKEDLEHIFEPFYTTKPTGVGLGLYVSKVILEEHDGHIDVESELGKGTTFNLWLPADDITECTSDPN